MSSGDALPAEGKYGKTKLFVGNLDEVQGALADIASAGVVLGTLEGQLKQLDADSAKILDAEKALELGITTTTIANAWKGEAKKCADIDPYCEPRMQTQDKKFCESKFGEKQCQKTCRFCN